MAKGDGLLTMLGGAAGAIGSTILGQWDRANAMDQQSQYNSEAAEHSKRINMALARYNQGLALDMWDKTNFAAQRAQMEKAGLSVGLMYGGGGGGATTQGGAAQGVQQQGVGQGSNAFDISGAMAQLEQIKVMKAQEENIKANTEKTKAETAKTQGVDTQSIEASIQNMKQATTNAELTAQILEYEKALKAIQANISNLTQDEVVKQTQTITDKLAAETRSATAKGNVDEGTQNAVIENAQLANKQLQAQTTATEASTAATKAGTQKTQQETTNLKQDEITKVLQNNMRQNGIEPSDNMGFRVAQKWLTENGVSLQSITDKMKAIMLWLKGQNGEQTAARFKEIMNQ